MKLRMFADEAEPGLECPSYPWPHQGILSSYDHALIDLFNKSTLEDLIGRAESFDMINVKRASFIVIVLLESRILKELYCIESLSPARPCLQRLVATHNTLATTLCYICAGNIDKTVEIRSKNVTAVNKGEPYFYLLQLLGRRDSVPLYGIEKKKFNKEACRSLGSGSLAQLSLAICQGTREQRRVKAKLKGVLRDKSDVFNSGEQEEDKLYMAIDEFGETISTSSEDSLLDDSLVFHIFILNDELPEVPYILEEITDYDSRRPMLLVYIVSLYLVNCDVGIETNGSFVLAVTPAKKIPINKSRVWDGAFLWILTLNEK
ncbi:hypothetical protein Tco_0345246 [Tanacetum coccineum]